MNQPATTAPQIAVLDWMLALYKSYYYYYYYDLYASIVSLLCERFYYTATVWRSAITGGFSVNFTNLSGSAKLNDSAAK